MEPERGAAWRPILGGELGARAEEAVTAVAEALAEPGAVPRASLGGGLPGIALLHGYLERARPGWATSSTASTRLPATTRAPTPRAGGSRGRSSCADRAKGWPDFWPGRRPTRARARGRQRPAS
jgi:hypothetical protein